MKIEKLAIHDLHILTELFEYNNSVKICIMYC